MSTLKVDTILKRTGTGTITVGQSGDTIAMPTATATAMTVSGATTLSTPLPVASGGTGGASFSAAGLANTPAFSVKLTSTQSISNSSETKVAHNSTLLDTNSGWDSSNYKYVFPTTGYYLVTHSLRYVSTTAPRLVSWVRRNGSGNENLNSVETCLLYTSPSPRDS